MENAIDVVLRRCEKLGSSPDVEALRARALQRLREAQSWSNVRPAPEEQERLMRHVLALHIHAAKLGRVT